MCEQYLITTVYLLSVKNFLNLYLVVLLYQGLCTEKMKYTNEVHSNWCKN